ncbi:response regulator, partial [Myxococcota bacterium]|nr:response regulator [Myxococcota bacterium]
SHHVSCLTDVTIRKTMEEHLRQSQRLGAIGQLAGGVAHDFNNLLGAIMGFTELALSEAGPNEELGSYLQKIRGASLRARDLARQILAFSRQEGGGKKPVELNIVLLETIGFLRGTVPSSISIKHHLDDPQCRIMANATELLQVFMNIATNAVQAMKDQGTLTIRLSRLDISDPVEGSMGKILPGRYCVIRISDTGSGMDKATMARIFDPYFTTKPVGSGTGLGLSVVYGIIKNHRGNITVTSLVGKGTTMNLFFPRIESLELAQTSSDGDISDLKGKGEILLVDDEAILVELGKKLVGMLGYSVTATTSSRQALAYIMADPGKYHLLITDQTMPEMLGTELIQAVRLIRPDLPALLITGYNSQINRTNAASKGIEHFYMKPLELYELARAILKAMGKSEPSFPQDQER